MKLLVKPSPIAAAVAKLDSRDPVLSTMRTAEWMNVPLAARERAFFSAGITHADFLATAQTKLLDALSLRKEAVSRGTAFVDRSSFIGDMRELALGAGIGKGGDSHDLTDPASRARLGLIWDIQTNFATGFARYQTDQDPDLLNAFPAQELLPSTARQPRDVLMPGHWARRWIAAGGKVIEDRIVGLKTDPAWERLSIFGLPYPPFDFGSQRDLADLSRAEAETLGLIGRNQVLQPSLTQFNDKLQASTQNLSPDIISTLLQLFGNKVRIQGTTAFWSPP
jgi:hypothetical protein